MGAVSMAFLCCSSSFFTKNLKLRTVFHQNVPCIHGKREEKMGFCCLLGFFVVLTCRT